MAVTFCSLPEFLPGFSWPQLLYNSFAMTVHILLSPLLTIWFILEYILQAILPICQAIPLTVNVIFNFCLNELKCGDSVCNVSVLIIPIYLTCTSSCEGNLNESSLFSSLFCCIFSKGWPVPGLAHCW